MLPGIKITFQNGALGQVEPSADGCLGFVAVGAQAEENGFQLETPYVIRNFAGLTEIGVSADKNPLLCRNVKDFYSEAPDGTELWIIGFDGTRNFTDVLDKDFTEQTDDKGVVTEVENAKAILNKAQGKIRGLIVFKTKSQTAPTITGGLDEDVTSAIQSAQALGEWATEELRAPIFTLIEGHAFCGIPANLKNLKTRTDNRVGIVIGDVVSDGATNITSSPNACMGIVAGRLASIPPQRKISRVKDGALTPLVMEIGGKLAELADATSIHDKGYITFRTFVGKTGYFISDDPLASEVKDDYSSITNRRVIDKAYRIAYNTLLDVLNDEVPIAADGNLSPAWCASVAGDVEQAIITQMTVVGNLGNDPADPNDTGVTCTIPYSQKILATSTFEVILRIKPNGYAKYIEVPLGFKTA